MDRPGDSPSGLRPRAINVPSVVDIVTGELRRLVLSGAFRPGERLVEERLTETFGVSRPPVREAMRLLEQQGLIHRVGRRGAYVADLTAGDVREIYVLRGALERLAVELGVPVIDPARLVPLRAALDQMRRAASIEDRELLLETNLEFHQALCALAGNRRLMQIYESLLGQSRLCMALNIRVRERLFGSLAENVDRHAALLTLIEAGDRSAVLASLRRHGDRSFMEERDAPG
jgi:DNA-binding GntR family transcriptional regulator